jgi:hypothetical protein
MSECDADRKQAGVAAVRRLHSDRRSLPRKASWMPAAVRAISASFSKRAIENTCCGSAWQSATAPTSDNAMLTPMAILPLTAFGKSF